MYGNLNRENDDSGFHGVMHHQISCKLVEASTVGLVFVSFCHPNEWEDGCELTFIEYFFGVQQNGDVIFNS